MFQPPSDSWMLVEQIGRESLMPGAAILDLCTGSGVLAIAAAQRAPGSLIVAVDISRRAVLATRVNARLNRVRVRAVRGELFSPVAGQRFDMIVSNPPYVPTPAEQVPARGPARAWEGGRDGRLFIDRICSEAASHLRAGGVLLLVHSSVCNEGATLTALSEGGLDAAVVARQRGPLGQRMHARAGWLARKGLLPDPETEELVVIRAQRGLPARTAAPTQPARRLRS